MAETQIRSGQSPHQSNRGTTTINDAVVISIAAQVVQEARTPNRRSAGAARRCRATPLPLLGSSWAPSLATQEAAAEFPWGRRGADGLDLMVGVPYGRSIPEVC